MIAGLYDRQSESVKLCVCSECRRARMVNGKSMCMNIKARDRSTHGRSIFMPSTVCFGLKTSEKRELRRYRKVAQEYRPGWKLNAGRRIYSLFRGHHVRS